MNVFITGGTSGIGLSLAKIYLKHSHRVGVCGFENDEWRASPERVQLSFFAVDVTDREQLMASIREFSRLPSSPGLDLLIASAGINRINNAYEETDLPSFTRERKIFEVNLLGTLSAFEAAVPIMASQRRGQIVAIASVLGLAGFAGNGGYCASKAAVINLCESYAIDLPRYGIVVTAICPGFVATPLTKGNPNKMPFLLSAPDAAERIARAIAKKRELYIFPWPAFLVVKLLALMPRWLYRRISRFGHERKMKKQKAE